VFVASARLSSNRPAATSRHPHGIKETLNVAELLTMESLVALLTLTALEIVLGIDNIVFIAILVQRLPTAVQSRARRLGLLGAMVTRILLLFSITWIMRLTTPLFTVLAHPVSARDLILMAGGLFLIGKATMEIHEKLDVPGAEEKTHVVPVSVSFGGVLLQIMVLDIVFSLDSVITAVGMAQHVAIMVAAVVAAVGIMLIAAGGVSRFIEKNPTLKMLALSFLLLIGVVLVAEGFGKHIEKGYIYFAMAFSLGVELLNLRVLRNMGLGRRKKVTGEK
jgi:predicted tellurium resistance membrane protein TerC